MARGVAIGLALLALCAAPGMAEDAGRRVPAGLLTPVSSESGLSPLERLKSRSATQRWRDSNAKTKQRPFWRTGAGQTPPAATNTSAPASGALAPRGTPAAVPVTPAQESAGREELTPQNLPPEVPVPEPESTWDDAAEEARTPVSANHQNPDNRTARRLGTSPQAILVARQMDNIPYSEPVRDPKQLKKLSAISPYSDYEPDSEVIGRDRCQNLCPRPLDKDCPDCPNNPVPGEPRGEGPDCPECPEEVRLSGTPYAFRNFPRSDYCWEAPNLWHYPLYFEDYALERYGHTRHYLIQPFISCPYFMFQLGLMPYQMTIDPAYKKRYTLGLYRPGEYVPRLYYQLPWNWEAALVQAGTVTGAYFLFSPTTGP